MRGTPREIVVEEVEHMLGFGERPNRIAEALGIQSASVAKACWRAGRPDLAVKFEQTRRAIESHPCMDCGAAVKSPVAPRCRPCGHRERSANLNKQRAS